MEDVEEASQRTDVARPDRLRPEGAWTKAPSPTSADEATVASGVELVSLKDGQAFLVGDHNGDVIGGADGLFDRDTRVLSRLVFLVGERTRPGSPARSPATTPSSPSTAPTAPCRR